MTDAIAKLLRSEAGGFYANYSTKLPGQIALHERSGVWIGTLDETGKPLESNKHGPFSSIREAGEWYIAKVKK